MSPKPIDVPRALRTLRREVPSTQATDHARAAVLRPATRRYLARPLAFAMIVAALALVVFIPRAEAGSAWAQTLAATLDAPASHLTTYQGNALVSEQWHSAERSALVVRDPKGTVMMELRDDGKRRLLYLDGAFVSRSPRPVNAHPFATVERSTPYSHSLEPDPTSADNVVNERDVSVIAHENAANGLPERYRVRTTRRPMRELVITLESGSRRIHSLENLQDDRTTLYEYPATILSKVFRPEAQAIQGVQTYDGETLMRIATQRVRSGLGRSGPVTLRLVALDAYGALWAYWTGALPSGDLKSGIGLPGVPSTQPFGTKEFTADWRKAPERSIESPLPERIGGMGVSPKRRIGSTVDLDVPYPGGTAHFQRVPVLRIATLGQIEDALGSHPHRP